jgi:hypothetical protein
MTAMTVLTIHVILHQVVFIRTTPTYAMTVFSVLRQINVLMGLALAAVILALLNRDAMKDLMNA